MPPLHKNRHMRSRYRRLRVKMAAYQSVHGNVVGPSAKTEVAHYAANASIRDCLTNHFSSCQSVGRRDLPLLRVLVGVLKEGEGSGHLVLRVIISGVLLGCCAINQSAPAGWQRALRPERRRWLGRD